MRKIIALLLALAIMFSATACAATREKIVKEEDVKAQVVVKKYKDMSLEEKLEYKASLARETAVSGDNGMLAPALDAQSNKWGYIKSDGSWAIEPQFNFAGTFSDGLAPVIDSYNEFIFVKTDGSKYISNIGGKAILGCTYASDGILPVALDIGQDQYKLYYLGDNKTIDATAFPKTNGVKYMNSKYFMIATQFFNGRAVVMRRTNEHLLASGENDRETIAKKSLYQSAYIIDKEGSILYTLPAGYDVADYGFDSNGIIIVCDQTTENCFYGLYDVYGRQVVECKYRRIEHCDGDNYLVCDENGFWGFITKDGKQITACMYVDAETFSDGLAVVSDGNAWGVIDESGNEVMDYTWNSFAPLKAANFDTNVGSSAYAFGVAAAQYGEYWALIDAKGEIKFAIKSETCPFGSLSGGLVSFCENELWGLMNSSGQIVVEPQFKGLGVFGN